MFSNLTKVKEIFISRSQAKKLTGLSYIGAVNSSSKIAKGRKIGIDTFVVYLAPHTLSGYNVCAMASKECISACLATAGRVKMDKYNVITNARIKKTKLFYENREFFLNWLKAEIESAQRIATKNGNEFAVRFNGTSDISPALLKLDGRLFFDYFSDVQFYDYTKVANRFKLADSHSNYHLTFSWTGHNFDDSMKVLENGGNVAVVFWGDMPKEYLGFKVIDGDITDYRPNDE